MLRKIFKYNKQAKVNDRYLNRRREFLKGIEQLEPRLLLDAGLVGHLQESLVEEVLESPASGDEIDVLLINNQLAFSEQLVQAASADSTVVRYDSIDFTTEGMIELLSDTLQREQASFISSLSLVTHGAEGTVHIGNQNAWNSEEFIVSSHHFHELGDLFSTDGVIYLYSCDVAAGDSGVEFVEQLSQLTGTHVFASNDPVGNVNAADWDWEYSTGLMGHEESFLNYRRLIGTDILLRGDWAEENSWGSTDTHDNPFYIGRGGVFSWTGLSVHNAFDEDWYYFYLEENGDANSYVEIQFPHIDGDLDIELYDYDGNQVGSSYSQTDNERISLDGAPWGIYSLRVYSYEWEVNDYSVHLSAPYDHSLPGDWLELPEDYPFYYPDIQPPGFKISSLSLHDENDVDTFIFKLHDQGTSSDFIAADGFDPTRSDLRINLWNQEEIVRTSTRGDGQEYIWLTDLPAGEYAAQIYSDSFISENYYNFRALGPAPSEDDYLEPNNTFSQATNLGNIYVQDVDLTLPSSDVDYYRIDLPVSATDDDYFTVRSSLAQADVALALYDTNLQQIRFSDTLSNVESVSFGDLEAGRYYVGVFNSSAETADYEFIYNPPVALAVDTKEANDSWSVAHDMGTLTDVISYDNLSIHSPTDNDWFKFSMSEWGTSSDWVDIDSFYAYGDLDLALFVEDGGQLLEVDRSENPGNYESITLDNLPPATYYLQVYGYDGSTNPNYSLSVWPPVPSFQGDRFEPNDEVPKHLGAIRSLTREAGLSIHDSNDVDQYSFTLIGQGTSSSQVSINFEHSQGDLDLALLDSANQIVDQSDSASSGELIRMEGLPAGTYTAVVYGYNGESNPNYELVLNGPAGRTTLQADNNEPNNGFSTAKLIKTDQDGKHRGISMVSDLTIHNATDVDVFKVETVSEGTGSHSISINTGEIGGDLQLRLSNHLGQVIAVGSDSATGETISLNGIEAGIYYVSVFGANSTINSYELVLDTPRSVIASQNKDAWTIMVYMTETNLIKGASDDLNQMEKALNYLEANVNIAVFLDKSQPVAGEWNYSTGDGTQAAWGDTGRAFMEPDSDFSNVGTTFEMLDEQNSAAPEVLSEFIDWATTERPAEKYALIMWNHGGGLSGFNVENEDLDDVYEDEMTAIELVQALDADIPRMDLVAFDACLMAMTEVAYSLKDHTDVFVASQELVSGEGYDYTTLFNSLRSNANSVTAEQLAADFVASFEAFYSEELAWNTNSAIKTEAFDSLGGELQEFTSLLAGQDSTVYTNLAKIRNATNKYGYGYDHDKEEWGFDYYADHRRDLGGFVGGVFNADINQAITNAAEGVLDALDSAVISKTNDSRNSSGLSVYLPSMSSVFHDYSSEFPTFNQDTNWQAFTNELKQSVTQVTHSSDWAEPNDSFYQARHLQDVAGSENLFPALTLDGGSDVDWFVFHTLNDSTVDHSLKVSPIDPLSHMTVSLLNSQREVISTKGGFRTQEISLDGLQEGTYFLRVESSDSYVEGYSFVLNVPEMAAEYEYDNTNDQLDKAEQLGVITSSRVISGQILQKNATKWYEFQSPVMLSNVPANLRITPTNNALVTVDLFNQSGEKIATGTGQNAIDLSYELAGAGEVYSLRVTAGDQNAAYTLAFTQTPMATEDAYSLSEDGELAVAADNGVLVNDFSPNGVVSEVVVLVQPEHGQLTLTNDGGFVYTPNADYSGVDSFIYVLDDGLAQSTAATVTLSIAAGNDAPSMNAIQDLFLQEDSGEVAVQLLGINAGANESQPLAITTSSSNQTLIDVVNVNFTSPSQTGELKFTPRNGELGETVITVTLEDGGLDNDLSTKEGNATFTTTFKVNVVEVNDAPTLDAISDRTVLEDHAALVVNLTGISAGDGERQQLRPEAFSDNPNLVPIRELAWDTFDNDAWVGTANLDITPVGNTSGSATITVRITDGGLDNDLETTGDNAIVEKTFDVTVLPVNDPPEINDLPDLVIDEDAAQQTVSFSGVSAGPNEVQPLRVTATSSNEALFANPVVSYVAGATTGNFSFTPLANQFGEAIITVQVEDGGLDKDLGTTEDNATLTKQQKVTIRPVNDYPTLVFDSPLVITENDGAQTIQLSGISAGGGEQQAVRIMATSSNPNLIPDPSVSYSEGVSTATLSLAPLPDRNGLATITVEIEDAGLDGNFNSDQDNAVLRQQLEVVVEELERPPSAVLLDATELFGNYSYFQQLIDDQHYWCVSTLIDGVHQDEKWLFQLRTLSGDVVKQFELERGEGSGQIKDLPEFKVDQQGNFYVLDTSKHNLYKFNEDGQLIDQDHSNWTDLTRNLSVSSGSAIELSAFAVTDNEVVLLLLESAQRSTNRLHLLVTDLNGEFVKTTILKVGNENQFGHLREIAVMPNDQIAIKLPSQRIPGNDQVSTASYLILDGNYDVVKEMLTTDLLNTTEGGSGNSKILQSDDRGRLYFSAYDKVWHMWTIHRTNVDHTSAAPLLPGFSFGDSSWNVFNLRSNGLFMATGLHVGSFAPIHTPLMSGLVADFSQLDVNLDSVTVSAKNDPNRSRLGHVLRVSPGRLINVNNDVELQNEAELFINGSELTFDHLRADSSSVLAIQQGARLVGSELLLMNTAVLRGDGVIKTEFSGWAGSEITATGDLSIGDISVVNGFMTEGEIKVTSGTTLELNSQTYAALGSKTIVNDATLRASNGIILGDGNIIQVEGQVDARFSAEHGSTILATGDLVIGDSNDYGGFFSDGDLIGSTHSITIQDKDWAVLGSSTRIGDTNHSGSLTASNGILLEAGKTLQGRGVIETAEGVFKNQGLVVAENGSIQFEHDVVGNGDFVGDIVFKADYKPGNSPGHTRVAGNITLGTETTLEIELGGTERGNEYDSVTVTGNSSLDGILDVRRINGFMPSEDDRFLVLETGQHTGQFDSITNLDLTEILTLHPTWDADGLSLTALDKYPWHNYSSIHDVNADGHISPKDAIYVINQINQGESEALAWPRPNGKEVPYYDVNRDGISSPIDALTVINELNSMSQSDEGEGEYYLPNSFAQDGQVVTSAVMDSDVDASVADSVDAAFLKIGMAEYNTSATVDSVEATELERSLNEPSDELEELMDELLAFE